ncbi:MAG: hypothetical protein ACXVCY_11835 [Pseudobdellovibrionaceae bacterium]
MLRNYFVKKEFSLRAFKKFRFIGFVVSSAGLIVFFQNCQPSPNHFSENKSQALTNSNGGNNIQTATASLVMTDCIIAKGENTCKSSITVSVANAAKNQVALCDSKLCLENYSNGTESSTLEISYGSTTYYLKDSLDASGASISSQVGMTTARIISQVAVTASCTPGTTYNASSNTCVDAIQPSTKDSPPTINSVVATTSATQPLCNTIRVAVSAVASTLALDPTPYSFDGGTTWQSSSTKDYSVPSLTLNQNQIKVRDIKGNIASFPDVVSGTSSDCQYHWQWRTDEPAYSNYANTFTNTPPAGAKLMGYGTSCNTPGETAVAASIQAVPFGSTVYSCGNYSNGYDGSCCHGDPCYQVIYNLQCR